MGNNGGEMSPAALIQFRFPFPLLMEGPEGFGRFMAAAIVPP